MAGTPGLTSGFMMFTAYEAVQCVSNKISQHLKLDSMRSEHTVLVAYWYMSLNIKTL